MKEFIIILLFLTTFFLFLNFARAQSIIGTTITTPFYPNQRAICRDGKNYIHVVWLYSVNTINYARSTDDGETWQVNTSFYGATSTPTSSKKTPHISCDGNNITVAYIDLTASDVVVGKSEDNGETWVWYAPVTSGAHDSALVERRGQRIYLIWMDVIGNIKFKNSTDAGQTWGPEITVFGGGCYGSGGSCYFYPTLAVDGSGSSSDKLYVSARDSYCVTWNYDRDFCEDIDWYIRFKYSSFSGAFWSSEMIVDYSEIQELAYPSITYNESKVYVSYYTSDNKIYFGSSHDYGLSWTTERIDTIIDLSKAQYPSIAVAIEGLPTVIWQQNDTTNNKGWNLIMRKFNGTNWVPEEGYWITEEGNINNQYPNLNFKSDGIAEFVWKKENNITYHKITKLFEKITLLPALGEFKILTPILYPEIRLIGNRKYLNIFWKSGYFEGERKEIAIKCFLNCFNPGDDIESNCAGYQNCTSIALAFTQAACTIQDPQYNFENLNLIMCKLFDPSFPDVEFKPYPNTTFWTLNFSLLPIKNITSTVGSSIVLPLTIKNLGLLDDTYEINITPLTNPNFISIKDRLTNLSLKSNELGSQSIKITPLFSTSVDLGIWVYSTSPEWFNCNNCPSGFVCEASSGKCSKYISLKIESGNSSLSEISSLEIIFLILIALFLIYKGL